MTRNWKERHISETGNRSMAFRDQKNWEKRSPEEQARLQFLRQKQQPEVDWSVDWENFYLPDDPKTECVFDRKKVTLLEGDVLEEIAAISLAPIHYDAPRWETYRVKAVLRSGKMLPYEVWSRIGPSSHWKTISRWIEEAGDLPEASFVVRAAVQEVKNQGYKDALDEIMAGDIAKNGTSANKRQNRALDLVANILKAWEVQERAFERPSKFLLKDEED